MTDDIQRIRRYIKQTPGMDGKMARRFSATFKDMLALADMAENSCIEAISLALEYGQARGLRMGRREAGEGRYVYYNRSTPKTHVEGGYKTK